MELPQLTKVPQRVKCGRAALFGTKSFTCHNGPARVEGTRAGGSKRVIQSLMGSLTCNKWCFRLSTLELRMSKHSSVACSNHLLIPFTRRGIWKKSWADTDGKSPISNQVMREFCPNIGVPQVRWFVSLLTMLKNWMVIVGTSIYGPNICSWLTVAMPGLGRWHFPLHGAAAQESRFEDRAVPSLLFSAQRPGSVVIWRF